MKLVTRFEATSRSTAQLPGSQHLVGKDHASLLSNQFL